MVPIGIAAPIAVVTARSRRLRVFTLGTLLLTLGAVWMTTRASSWLWTSSAEILLEKLQFPWRWQVVVTFGVALLLTLCVESLYRIRRLPAFTVPLLAVILSAYLLAYPLVRLNYPADDTSYRDISAASLWQEGLKSGYTEFMPIWMTEEHWAIGGAPSEPIPVIDAIDSVAVVPTRAGLLQQQFQVTTENAFRLRFHQFYFPAWRVTIDGVQVDTQPATNLALASVMVPPGTHTVELAWGATRAVWLGRALTAVGWVVVLALLSQSVSGSYAIRSGWRALLPSDRRHWPLAVWLAVGAFMAVVSSGITARAWDVSAIGADYGGIRLEGVRQLASAHAGEVVPVQLTWFVKDSEEPVRAFVHLRDDADAGIAQYDGPPGGEYTPYPRWTPGMIIHSTHHITIPASLPPGTYRLVAGLYRPDISHDPLVPLGNTDSPYLEIGRLQVVP